MAQASVWNVLDSSVERYSGGLGTLWGPSGYVGGSDCGQQSLVPWPQCCLRSPSLDEKQVDVWKSAQSRRDELLTLMRRICTEVAAVLHEM